MPFLPPIIDGLNMGPLSNLHIYTHLNHCIFYLHEIHLDDDNTSL